MSAEYDFPLLRQQLEIQMDDYEQEIATFSRFMDVWRERQKAGHEFVDYETGEVSLPSCSKNNG